MLKVPAFIEAEFGELSDIIESWSDDARKIFTAADWKARVTKPTE